MIQKPKLIQQVQTSYGQSYVFDYNLTKFNVWSKPNQHIHV